MIVSLDAAAYLAGDPLGTTYPARAATPPLPERSARELSLRTLREYLSRITFRRPMAEGQPTRGFRVPVDRIHIFRPDDPIEVKFPSIGFVPGVGVHDYYGLGGPVILDETLGAFGAGTALARFSDYVEEFAIEVFSAKHGTGEAIVAGLNVAMRPLAETSTLRINVANYFGQVAVFSLAGFDPLDEPEDVKNRRRAQLKVELRVPEVAPVNVATMIPIVSTGGIDSPLVFDGNLYANVDGDLFPSAAERHKCADP